MDKSYFEISEEIKIGFLARAVSKSKGALVISPEGNLIKGSFNSCNKNFKLSNSNGVDKN